MTLTAKGNTLGSMYAVIAVNVEAGLKESFHYHIPADLAPTLKPGHLVEVEFGRRLAQGIVVALDSAAPVEETKPIISLVADEPVIWPWQIELAQWLSDHYLAPLNSCLRLMLPPGLSRMSDITVDLDPRWDGSGRRTELQQQIIELVQEKGDMRGRQIGRALPKTEWKNAVNQLAKRGILRKASVLDPPSARPKKIRTAELIAGEKRVFAGLMSLGRRSRQADILQFLLESDDPLPNEETVLAGSGATAAHLKGLADQGLIIRQPAETVTLPDGQTAQTAAAVTLGMPASELVAHICRLRGAEKYRQILALLRQEAQPVSIAQIYEAAEANISHLRKLVKLDLIRLGSEEVWRDPLADRDFAPAEPPTLTMDQARVWGRVKIAMIEAEPDEDDPAGAPRQTPFLLHGVTGSGKTEIYMRAIDFAIQRGQQAIVLVPEIALTPQTVRRFAARFPGRVAVLHSRLTDGERYDTWRRARQGLFDIVVGARSALFSPLPNIGVIVIDEEHDPSYKQTPPVPPPYYHTRESARMLAGIIGATLIMGSATPDLVTYHQARAGGYQLLELPRRVMGHRRRIESQASRLHVVSSYRQEEGDPDDALTIPLPPIQVVDLRQELRAGNRSIFSRALEAAISETLERGEQAIIFLNRRGTASFVLCRDCGHVLACPRCDMPLTYHRPHMALVCHHCGRREPPRQECPQCHSKRIKFFGLGTEEVEAKVQQRWPAARVTRWDRDTTAGRDAHEQLLATFINQEADILVGTQMIAKGLDLPLVTLVGVISADVSLGLPDFRTGERAFQVLAQVAGRAGRGLLGGRVIIQTYKPEHYAIQAAAEHDFVRFYLEEIRFRTQQGLPPFRRMAKLLLIDPVDQRAQQEAEELAKRLRQHAREQRLAATQIFGPTPPFFNRIDGRYRWQIIIRAPDPAVLLADFEIPPKWMVDIDPVSTL